MIIIPATQKLLCQPEMKRTPREKEKGRKEKGIKEKAKETKEKGIAKKEKGNPPKATQREIQKAVVKDKYMMSNHRLHQSLEMHAREPKINYPNFATIFNTVLASTQLERATMRTKRFAIRQHL